MIATQRPTIRLGIVVLLLYLAIYASVSLRMGLHWDEVLDYDGSACGTYTAGGRWFTGAFRCLTGGWEPPAVSAFTAGCIVAGLVFLQCHADFLRQTWQRVAYASLYLSCIQWASMLRYSIMAESIAIGMFCATVAAWLCYKPGWKCAVTAALLLAVALGAYQTLALYFGVAWLLLRLSKLRGGEGGYSLRPWIRMACVAAAGIAVWFGIHKLSLAFISQETLDYVQGYQGRTTQWGRGVTEHDIGLLILCHLHYFKYTLMAALGIGRETYWLFATALLPLGGLIHHALRRASGMLRVEQCFIALLIWWLPFCMSLLVLTPQGFHTALSAPLGFAGLWMVWLAGARLSKRHTAILCLLGGGIIGAAAITVLREAQREASLHKNSIELITTMKEKGRACAADADMPQAPIIVLADMQYETTPFCGAYSIVAGSSCMDWYCRAYGITGIRMGDSGDMQRHRACWEEMPSWPQEGAVKEDGGEIIIKVERRR